MMDVFFGINGDCWFYIQGYLNYECLFGLYNVSGMLFYNQDDYNMNVNSSFIVLFLKCKMGVVVCLFYDYDYWYMFEVNVGYNGFESFVKGYCWGLFLFILLGWNISEEKFWKLIKLVIFNFKVCGLYGLVGND